MRFLHLPVLIVLFNCFAVSGQDYSNDVKQLYHAVKSDDAVAVKLIDGLSKIDKDQLKLHLNSENKAKAFWINVYNTFVQYLLKKDPALFDDRTRFFSEPRITIAGQALSLDDIEHGIIRSSKNKYSLGYLGKVFVDDFEETFRLKEVDYRIHFALNCGAKSCPPVALYHADQLDTQLDKSSLLYLKSVVKFDKAAGKVYVPKLCSWFKADFGGEDGVIAMLHKYQIIPKGKKPEVEYLDYNWDLSLSNYIDL